MAAMSGMLRVFPVLFVLLAALSFGGCSSDDKGSKTPIQVETSTSKATPTVKDVFDRAVSDLRDNEIDRAVNGFALIIEKAYPGAPERAFAYAYLGQIAFRAGKTDAAIENFEGALQESPEMTPTRMALANAYFSAGRIDDAIKTWESLAAANPNLATVHNNLGVAYLDKDDATRAIQHLEQTIAISPENVRAHANLAIAYRKSGMEESAQAAERKVAAIRARIAAKVAPAE